MDLKIEELERRYQLLFSDYQAGKIDEAMFIAEVDGLQFQDDWGRYWMLGAQSGSWHYYDGQNWHQANPREADNLAFMDDQGRYWQKGANSGDWYYFNSETNEWVKQGEDDLFGPSSVEQNQWQAASANSGQPAHSYEQPQAMGAEAAPAMEADAQLFQDDDGRYWAAGAKTGQWYFYDEQGWHPAQEFQGGVAPQQAQQPTYQAQPNEYSRQQTQPQYQAYGQSQPTQVYPTQPQQPVGQQFTSTQEQASASRSQPTQVYPNQASASQPAHASQPTHPAPSTQTISEDAGPAYAADPQPESNAAPAEAVPTPPQGASQSGGWFYFDGSQWLKYSTGEPATESPPDPTKIKEQNPAKVDNNDSVVAEFYKDDEPPIEVVDVEVITVIEAEPDRDLAPEPQLEPDPDLVQLRSPVSPDLSTYTQSSYDEIRPRRSKSSPEIPIAESSSASSTEPQRQSKRRAPSDPVRPITPRKKSVSQEPTIIIPTGSSASSLSSPPSAMGNRPTKRRTQSEQRRAREATLSMEPLPLPSPEATVNPPSARTRTRTPAPTPVSTGGRHRQVTQAMPVITAAPAGRAESTQMKAQRARQDTEQISAPVPTPAPANQAASSEKEGYTFGEILRSFPSTFWTGVAGVAILLFVGILIIVGAVLYSNNDPFSGPGIAALQSPTPTLGSIAADATPTIGPIPTEIDPLNTPTPTAEESFSSSELGFSLDYPGNWQIDEAKDYAIFSPSSEGLDPETFEDSNIQIGTSTTGNDGISELLTEVLTHFPEDIETLNQGTISIASQTWTSTQIRFNNQNSDGQNIATVAVTNKDGKGYYLIATASSEEWNAVQPLFQGMINSFKFGVFVAQAPTVTPEATSELTVEATDEADEEGETTVTPASTKQSSPIPEAVATPVVHTIESGDTLLGIAVQYGVDVDLLASENGITDPGTLSLGQELTIPFTAEELAAFNDGQSGTTEADSTTVADNETDNSAAASDTSTTENESDTSTTSVETETTPEDSVEPSEALPLTGKIVYPAFDPGPNIYSIWIVDLATGEQSSPVGNASQPAFNSDGNLLAYRSWDRGTRGIFFRDFIGGRGGKVTNFVEDGMPAWSPDGYSFAFASRKEGDRVARIYIGNQSAENPLGLAFQGEYPSVFPNGQLVVKGCTPTGDCGIFTMGPTGGGEQKISTEAADTAPAPSPDGNKVAFMSIGRGGNNWEIWVMNADGSNPQRLTENGSNDGLPTWSPDGQSIAYVSDQGGVWGIWAMNVDGSNQRKVADMKGSPDGIVLHDESSSKGWLEERISWAP